jgi:hypothetical protein
MKNKKNPISATEQKINSFKDLPIGWHYGSGIPPSDKILALANQLNRYAGLMNFEATDAFPGIDGEVMLTVYDGDIYLEFSIELNGLINYVREQSDEEVDSREQISLHEAINYIEKIGILKCRSSVSFTPNITIRERKDSRVPRLSRVKPIESQFSMRNVQFKQVEAYARTYESSTLQLQENHRYSGKSHLTSSTNKAMSAIR